MKSGIQGTSVLKHDAGTLYLMNAPTGLAQAPAQRSLMLFAVGLCGHTDDAQHVSTPQLAGPTSCSVGVAMDMSG